MSLCRKILQLFFGPLLVQAMCGAQSLTTSLDHENSYGLLASTSSCFLEGVATFWFSGKALQVVE